MTTQQQNPAEYLNFEFKVDSQPQWQEIIKALTDKGFSIEYLSLIIGLKSTGSLRKLLSVAKDGSVAHPSYVVGCRLLELYTLECTDQLLPSKVITEGITP